MREGLVSTASLAGDLDDELARRWQAAVHDYVRGLRSATVVRDSYREPGPGWNYYSIRIAQAGTETRLLLNASTSVVAASLHDGVALNGPLEFVRLTPDSFERAGFVVPTLEELLAPLRESDLLHLTPEDRRSIAYFQPERVGEVAFNWFD